MNSKNCLQCQKPPVEGNSEFRCNDCKTAYYCDRNCQRMNWEQHKITCIGYLQRKAVALCKDEKQIKIMKNIFSIEKPKEYLNVVTIQDVDIHIDYHEKLFCSDDRLVDKIDMFSRKLPLPLHYSKYIEVRDSVIHGKGVFTTETIPSNTIITFYPCHFLTQSSYYGKCHEILASKDTILTPELQDLINDIYIPQYKANNKPFSFIGDPTKIDKKNLLGHMINDASGNVFSGVSISELEKGNTFKELILKHFHLIEKNANCKLIYTKNRYCICISTIKEIEKDTELLLSYAMFYWIEQEYGLDFQEKFPFIKSKMYTLMMNDQEFSVAFNRFMSLDI